MNNDITNIDFTSSNEYRVWKENIVTEIDRCRLASALKVNQDLLQLYWFIGNQILEKQRMLGWGSNVIDNLSHDLSDRYSDMKGFSVRNLKYMRAFAESYPEFPIVQVSLAQNEENKIVQVSLAQITWYHHISLITRVKDIAERAFYIQQTAQNGWSRDVMLLQIDSDLYHRQGMAITNFSQTLPTVQSDLAKSIFKDPYNFGFLGMAGLQREMDIERKLTEKITDFLLELGSGFSFVGRQYHIVVDGDDYYVDLLMYHLKLHCYVAIELKAGEFKPEFVSKLNFYISAIDDIVKTSVDNPTIGLLLCREKSNVKAKYALRGTTQPLGIAQYETEQLFADVKSSLPTIEEIENNLNQNIIE